MFPNNMHHATSVTIALILTLNLHLFKIPLERGCQIYLSCRDCLWISNHVMDNISCDLM